MNTVKKINAIIDISFTQLPHDVINSFEKKVNDFIKKWQDLKVLDKKWANYVKSNYCKPGTMYGLIKTHKQNNPVRVITNECGTAIEYLSTSLRNIYIKKLAK